MGNARIGEEGKSLELTRMADGEAVDESKLLFLPIVRFEPAGQLLLCMYSTNARKGQEDNLWRRTRPSFPVHVGW